MKKRFFLIPVCIFSLVLICFLWAGHIRRNEIFNILARQLTVDENADADVWISSSDTTYNWVHRSLDFSIGIESEKVENVSAVFVFTGDHPRTVSTGKRQLKRNQENIFTSSMPYQKLSSGNWVVSVYLLDQDNQKVPLKNPDSKDNALVICTFTVR